MPTLAVDQIYRRSQDREEFAKACREWEEKWSLIAADLESYFERVPLPRKRPVPGWIRRWAEEVRKNGVTLDQALARARQISRKFARPLSEEIIAERDERR